ncbi:MAG: hypothetical protein J7K78_04615 [Thaumarchaeota archaeon]|nr:hypothetical protein [Nitrososphaerota archaeon]
MSEEFREYSRLLERVLARFPELTREEVEAMVEAKLRESKFLNRIGALLLVAEELGAFKEVEKSEKATDIRSYVKIGKIVPGLRDVSVRGVIFAITKPIELKDHRMIRLKIGDETGSIDVIIWDEKAEEAFKLGLELGDQIAILHGYTRERIETGKPEIHVGRNGIIAKLEEKGPDPRSFYMDLGEALEHGDGIYDVKAMVLEPGEEKLISTRYGDAHLREIRLIGESGGVRLTIWRDRVEEFKDLREGETIYLTDLRIEDGKATLTPRSILAIREAPTEETLRMINERKLRGLTVRVLDIVETRFGAVYIVTDGSEILRIRLPKRIEADIGDHLKIREALKEVRRGKARLICGEEDLEKIEPEKAIEVPDRRIRLRDLSSKDEIELYDVIVEGVLYTKTQPIKVKTKFGEAEKIGFWIKDEGSAIQAVAWRDKADEISRIAEGARIRLKWVSIRMNAFNEPEIQLDNESIIEVLESGEEKLSEI